MLLGADHVADPHRVVVDHARQVVEEGPVGALDHLVLLAGPFELHVATDPVAEPADALARHLQPDHRLAALALEAAPVGVGLRHERAAVDEAFLGRLRGLALGLQLLGRGVIVVRQPGVQQRVDGCLVETVALRLVIRSRVAADLRALVPVDPEPAEPVQDRLQRLVDVPLPVRVVDAQDETAAVAAGVEPVEQRRAHAADVQETGGAGREARANLGHAVQSTRPGGTGSPGSSILFP